MRLNWNNIGKGLEGIADAKRASDLARESARYDVTEGAYGEGLGQNLQNVIGARDQALQRLSGDAYIRGEEATPEERQQIIDQYTPALSELSRRVGLQSPDYSVASGPTNFATRQEARQAAAPLRAEGLAGVYRRYGDVERADALEARAYEQQRALAAERRAEAGEGRAQLGFKTQQEASLLTIDEQKRLKKQRDEDEARQKQLSQDWANRLAVKDADGNVTGMRPPTNDDMMWAAQRSANNLAAAGKTTEALAVFKDYMTTAKGQIELQSVERAEAVRIAVDRANRGDFDGAKDFYDKFVPDGAKVKEFKQNADGSITVKRVDLNGNPLPDTKTTKDEILRGLVSFNDPAKLIEYTQQSFLNNLKIRQVNAAETNAASSKKMADANVGLIKARTENFTARTAAMKDSPPLTEAQVTARANLIVKNRQINPQTRKPFTPTEAVEFVKSGARDPVMDALDKALGGDTDPFAK